MEHNIHFREMTPKDIPEVGNVERLSFQTPWSEESFLSELLYNQLAHYYVVEIQGVVVGYGGMWIIVDEGHITNIAVHPAFRGKGLGHVLVQGLLAEGNKKGCSRYTLEVRPSNTEAIALYEKYGFEEVGRRPKYYQDSGEDALIMWKEPEN